MWWGYSNDWKWAGKCWVCFGRLRAIYQLFESLEDAYMRERAADIKDVTEG